MSLITTRINYFRGFGFSGSPLDPEIGLAELTEAELTMSTEWESFLLVADPAVTVAANRWKETVWRLAWYAQGLLTEADEFDEAATDCADAKMAFYAAARADIGVPGDLPERKWPPRFQLSLTAETLDRIKARRP